MPIPSIRKVISAKKGTTTERWIGWSSGRPVLIETNLPLPREDAYGNVYRLDKVRHLSWARVGSAVAGHKANLKGSRLLRDSEKLLSRIEWHARVMVLDDA
jgi:hypothetical protein